MRLCTLALPAALVFAPIAVSRAQDTTARGVTIGLSYDPSSRPGVVVLPVRGATGDSVRAIVQRDLDYSDRFTVIPIAGSDPDAFRGETPGSALNYPLFARLGAVAVVQITPTDGGGLHAALHDVARGNVLSVDEFALPAQAGGRDWRMAVHGVSDEIERWVTGQKGIAQSRIAYVESNTIRVIDSDGAGEESFSVTPNAMSPAWNPAGTLLVYSTFGATSRIVLLDVRTRQSRSFANATPMNTNLTPVFSPDGSAIVYSHASETGSDLYLVMTEENAPARRISVGRGTDNAQPTFSPDGRRIAFTSGRAGHPEVYIMDADGTNAELLTSFDFGDKNYRSDPDWSPDGRLVAFQSQFPGGRFQLMTISLRDRSTKLLTSEGSNEQPSWAPDGRHIVFTSTRSGRRQLWVLDAESGRMRQLTRTSGARLAAWSPRLGSSAVTPNPAGRP
jgi:TolB protein